MKVGSVVIDCNDFEKMMTFWREALRYVPREPADDDWVVLRPPDGEGVNVSLQKVPEKSTEKNRLHLDLYTDDQEGEVTRLVELGATIHRRAEAGSDFVGLRDPEGNLFCVVEKVGP